MTSEKILALLHEAASIDRKDPDYNGVRMAQIQGELKRGLLDRRFEVVLDGMFAQTVRERQHFLMAMFPIFSFLCGDAENSIVADIDWSAYDQMIIDKTSE